MNLEERVRNVLMCLGRKGAEIDIAQEDVERIAEAIRFHCDATGDTEATALMRVAVCGPLYVEADGSGRYGAISWTQSGVFTVPAGIFPSAGILKEDGAVERQP